MKGSTRIATTALMILFSLVVIFHILILTGMVSSEIVWGGRIQTEQLTMFETISIVLNGVFLWIVAMRAGLIKSLLRPKVLRIILWVMTGLFLLNTLGNLAAVTSFERYVFTPLTLLIAVFCGILAYNRD